MTSTPRHPASPDDQDRTPVDLPEATSYPGRPNAPAGLTAVPDDPRLSADSRLSDSPLGSAPAGGDIKLDGTTPDLLGPATAPSMERLEPVVGAGHQDVSINDDPGQGSAASGQPEPVSALTRRLSQVTVDTGGGRVPPDREDRLRSTLAAVAPGTDLRDGLERILRGNTGGLIVLGYDKTIESLCTGGFRLDVEFSATRLRELAKMDGAVVLSSEGTHIVRAAVQLVPDPSIHTDESGTRHRTAERVARQTGFPVISVSQSMRIIGLYVAGMRYVLDGSAAIMSRANQALATLERYKLRLDEVAGTLSALEIEDLVTVRDAMAVVQRLEMVRRIAGEISGYVIELGTDGRLLSLQLEELMAGVDEDRTLVVRDYVPPGRRTRTPENILAELDTLSSVDMLDLTLVAKCCGFAPTQDALEGAVSPRGYRLLAKVPRLPSAVIDRLVDHFGGLQRLLGASVEHLQAVEGIGDARARSVREGLSRLAESSILERYV